MSNFEILQLSSLAKIFRDKIYGCTACDGEIARGQSFYYQIAYRGTPARYSFEIQSPIKEKISVSKIGYVPSNLPAYKDCENSDYLRTEPGIFPDVLFPTDNTIEVLEEYNGLWLSIEHMDEGGEFPITVVFLENEREIAKTELVLTVHNVCVPEQKLLVTQWFHTDCIADVHNVKVFSEEHWSLIEKYLKMASSHGINLILTPVLTPPLDTEVGGERTTVQLVEITKCENTYTFDFSRLERFIDICLKCNIRNFEINHLFTQWGAEHAPKVIANVNGNTEKIFGWETDATSSEYADFLNQLLPWVIEVFEKKGIERKSLYFHVSDEPNDKHLENYKKAYKILEDLIEGCNQIDALSHFEFYEQKIVKTPVVATTAIEPFLKAGVKDLWCYYCCVQSQLVANRFMAMPSYRNRIIGVQMYKCSVVGFLQWGYNFYNLQYSKGKINPYVVTDAGGSFPSGDAFSVYPYENDVIPSFRLKVFKNAIEDISLLTALEEKIGKKAVVKLIDDVAGMDVTFENYPRNEEFFKNLYKEIFAILRK